MKKSYDLSGKTAEEALKIIADATGRPAPDEVVVIIESLARADGGRIKSFQLIDTGKGEEKILTPGFMTDAELADGNAELREEPWFQDAIKKHGEPGPYNGIPGDSCRCDVCVLRRRVHGVLLTTDMDKGMSPEEVAYNLHKGYKGDIPAWADTKHNVAFVAELTPGDNPDEAIPLEEYQNWKPIPEHVKDLEKFARARPRMVKIWGEGSPEVKRADELMAIMGKPDSERTEQETKVATELFINMIQDTVAAGINPPEVDRLVSKYIDNRPQRYTQ